MGISAIDWHNYRREAMTKRKRKVFVPPNTIEDRTATPIPQGFREQIIQAYTNATSKEIALLINDLTHCATVICYHEKDELAYHVKGIAVIDDAIHLVLDLKNTF